MALEKYADQKDICVGDFEEKGTLNHEMAIYKWDASIYMTEEEIAAEEAYLAAVNLRESTLSILSRNHAKAVDNKLRHLEDSNVASAKLPAFQAKIDSAGEDVRLHRGAKEIICRNLTNFLTRQVGESVAKEACILIEEYLTEFPNATLVPVKPFEGEKDGDAFSFPAQVVDADSLEVIVSYKVVRA